MGSDERNARQTMAEISHANPRTGTTLGAAFRRGPAVADGGADPPRGDADTSDSEPSPQADARMASPKEDTRMADVEHTPEAGVNDVWERGSKRVDGGVADGVTEHGDGDSGEHE